MHDDIFDSFQMYFSLDTFSEYSARSDQGYDAM